MSDTYLGTLSDVGAIADPFMTTQPVDTYAPISDLNIPSTIADVAANSGLSVSAETNDAGAVSGGSSSAKGGSFLETLWNDVKGVVPAAIGKINTNSDSIWAKAFNSAKASILGTTAKNLSQRADVQAAAKESAGNALGNWILKNWLILTFAGVGVGAVLFFTRRK